MLLRVPGLPAILKNARVWACALPRPVIVTPGVSSTSSNTLRVPEGISFTVWKFSTELISPESRWISTAPTVPTTRICWVTSPTCSVISCRRICPVRSSTCVAE